nr:tetratricopeptide repeat protein [Tatlockia sp.]
MRGFCFFLSLIFVSNTYAFSWADLWFTKNQQAQKLMNKGQFKEAEKIFQQPDWRATAAYRAGEYKQSAKQFQGLQNESGFYNQGNALAHSGNYEQAIKAYNAALALNPNNKDALDNRKILQDLLKKKNKQPDQSQKNKDQQNKEKQDQNQKDKDQQNKEKQGQNKQDKEKQDKEKQGQNQQDKDKQDKEKQNQNQQDKDKQDKEKQGQNQQDKDKQDKNKQDKDKQGQNQQEKDQQNKHQQGQNQQEKGQQDKAPAKAADKKTPEELEKQQAKEQWLRLIPDDPAGLMREKFLRDHLR